MKQKKQYEDEKKRTRQAIKDYTYIYMSEGNIKKK